MRSRRFAVGGIALIVSLSGAVHAQPLAPSPAPAPTSPDAAAPVTSSPAAAPPPAAPAPVPPPAPAAVPPPAAPQATAQEACFPACREGFLCHRGACVSACNPACAPGQTCTAGGRCVAEPPAAPVTASGAPLASEAGVSPALADAGWARGAAVFGYISGAVILAGTAGVMALNDSSTDDDSRTLGIVTTLYLAAAAPVVGVGGASARSHPSVKGSTALRIASWIGYGITLVDAAFLVAVSFESEVSNAHILSVGVLGALSSVGLAVDAHASASEADALRASAPASARDSRAFQAALPSSPRLTLEPALGITSGGASNRKVPLVGLAGTF